MYIIGVEAELASQIVGNLDHLNDTLYINLCKFNLL